MKLAMFVLTVACAAPALAAERGTDDAKTIRIGRVEAAPRLDDYIGGKGPGVAVEGFVQREPGDLTPVSEPTTAFLSYDNDNLYVAFVCRANPSSIRARMARRESIFEDDWVAVNTIIEERTVRDLIPRLKSARAQGIVEYPLNKIVV